LNLEPYPLDPESFTL